MSNDRYTMRDLAHETSRFSLKEGLPRMVHAPVLRCGL